MRLRVDAGVASPHVETAGIASIQRHLAREARRNSGTLIASRSAMGPMIVACTDFSPCSEAAVAEAAELARLRRGRVLLIHVCEPPTRKERSMETWNESAIRKLTAERRKHFHDFSDNDVQYDAVPSSEPVSTICKIARQHDAAMVVVGSHGRTGLSRRVLGSVAENVVRHAPCSVLVARAPKLP